MSPTYEVPESFFAEYAKMSRPMREAFKQARDELIAGLDSGGPSAIPGKLRVQGVQGHPGVYEMTFAADGRATFSYGDEVVPGKAHILWRRVGTHSIFKRP